MNILRCGLIGEAMHIKKIVYTLMILVPCLIYSQDFVNIQNLKTLSDKEVLSYWEDAKSNGYTIDQIKTIASSQGVSASDILEFEERLNELLELESADLMVGSDESVSSVITQTDNDLSNETGLTLFGKEFFLKSSLDTSPQINIATPQLYQLGPGDEITISIWGAAEAGYKLGVNKEGYVKIPRIAPVFISGLTVKEATLKLERSLSKIYSGLTSNTNSLNKTFYSLSLSKTRSVVINILGEVVSPGLYTVSSMSSVLNALYFAGGPNEIGTYRSIDIIRNGEKLSTVDLYDYFLNGVSQNIFLRDQDVILVKAYKKRASSTGEFKRNNIFELTENETVSDLIKYSGEFNSLAFKNEVYIERIDGINKKIIALSKEAFQNEKIYDGDILMAKAVSSEVMNKVSIEGSVIVTGDFQLEKAKTVKGLFELSQGFEKDAVTNFARLFREKNGAVRELLSIEIEKIINGTEKDIELEPNDRIVVSSINDLEALGSVRIIGEVNEPGEYAFYDGITVESLVVSAKGFSPFSNSNEILVYRLTYDETGESPVRTLSSTINKNFESEDLNSSVKLEKNDLVVVRKNSGYSEIETATIVGLVKNQGEYALKNSSYSLYDILVDSGGFLDDASVEGLSIERNSTIFSVNVSKLLESRGASVKNNIVLKNGDVITVPKIDNTVFIDGEVGSPKFIYYEAGLSLKNAINRSGGFTPLSDRKGSYVQYQNGNIKSAKRFLFFNFYPKVKAGSKIFVPTKPEKTNTGGILNSVVGELLTVVTTLGTLGALLKSVN